MQANIFSKRDTTMENAVNTALQDALRGIQGTFELSDNGQDFKVYRNNSYNVVSIFGYLIGVPKDQFMAPENPAMMESMYKKLSTNKNARIIRNLCIIRTCMEKNYINIVQELLSGYKNIDNIPDLIPVESVNQLYSDGISLVKTHHDIDQYIITINKEISNRVGNIKNVFPEWLKWDYIKPLFIMPNGTAKEGIKDEGMFYNTNRNRYPYQVYMNWVMDDVGNILYCDEKFVKLLYEFHEDYFTDSSLVRNAGDLTVESINEFLEEAQNAIFVVDCENSNPVKLASVLSGLTGEQKERIKGVLLFDSHYTNEGWGIMSESDEHEAREEDEEKVTVDTDLFDWASLESTAGVKMEHIVVERLLEAKSQVDMTLAVRTTQEVYKNNVDSVVLVSSDSDYWAMIRNLPEVKFMVMLERDKTSPKIKESLDSKGIKHCFLDDFYTGVSYSLKTEAICKYIQTYLDKNVSFDAEKLLDNAVHYSWLDMTDKEKEGFMDKYIRQAHVKVENGRFRVILGEK